MLVGLVTELTAGKEKFVVFIVSILRTIKAI